MPPATVQEHAGKEKITRAVASGTKGRGRSGVKKTAELKKEKTSKERELEASNAKEKKKETEVK